MSIRELQNQNVANSLGLATLADITTSGVSSLEGLNGAITLSSPDASILINNTGNDIELTTAGSSGVTSLNTLTGAVTVSAGTNIYLNQLGNDIEIVAIYPAPPTPVTSLDGLTGAVTLSSPDGSIVIGGTGNDISLEAVIPLPPVTSVGGKTGTPTFATGSGIAINYGSLNVNPITIANTGILSVVAGTGISTTTVSGTATINNTGILSIGSQTGALTLTGTGITITQNLQNIDFTVSFPTPPVYQATYYKSVQQNLVSPDTDITFDLTGSWNNPNGYITHVDGTKDFTVVQTGLYQLEFNISVNANGATWNAGVNKVVSIDITRTTEQAVIQNSSSVANSLSYQQSVVTSYYLVAGDVINLRSTLAYATATPFAVGFLNTFDLNTFFNWRFIS